MLVGDALCAALAQIAPSDLALCEAERAPDPIEEAFRAGRRVHRPGHDAGGRVHIPGHRAARRSAGRCVRVAVLVNQTGTLLRGVRPPRSGLVEPTVDDRRLVLLPDPVVLAAFLFGDVPPAVRLRAPPEPLVDPIGHVLLARVLPADLGVLAVVRVAVLDPAAPVAGHLDLDLAAAGTGQLAAFDALPGLDVRDRPAGRDCPQPVAHVAAQRLVVGPDSP